MLLMAQLGAMSHAYSHDAAVGSPPTHQSGVSSHEACKDCLAYAPLLAVAGACSVLPFALPPGHGAAARRAGDSVADLSLTLAFRSRAPPESL